MAVERLGWARALRRRLRFALRRLLLARRRLADYDRYADQRAYRRSRNLLRRCLSPAQRGEFERARTFTVRARSGRLYRIGYGSCVNVEVLAPSGEVDYRLCAGPSGVPIPTVMLAQKLMLEAQEAEFLRIAVRHPAVPAMQGGWQRLGPPGG
jgi:hypothetical protein